MSVLEMPIQSPAKPDSVDRVDLVRLRCTKGGFVAKETDLTCDFSKSPCSDCEGGFFSCNEDLY